MKISMLASMVAVILTAGCTTHPREVTVVEPPPDGTPPLSSPGSKFAILPVAVQRTVTANSGMAEIKDINKVPQLAQDVYEVQFANPLVNPDLYVGLDGKLVKTNTLVAVTSSGAPVTLTPTGRSESGTAIPLPVQKTLQLQAPNATVATIQSRERTIYEVTFVDPNSHPKMWIAEDGTVLKEQ